MVDRLLGAPMSFFDTTPLGRIMNRVSRDMDAIDFSTPLHMRNWFFQVVPLLATVVLISYGTPAFLVAVLPIAVFFFFIQVSSLIFRCLKYMNLNKNSTLYSQKLYSNIVRQLVRIEAAERSPVFAHFDATLNGAASIRAFGLRQIFIEKCDHLVDNCQKAHYLYHIAQRSVCFYTSYFKSLKPSLLPIPIPINICMLADIIFVQLPV